MGVSEMAKKVLSCFPSSSSPSPSYQQHVHTGTGVVGVVGSRLLMISCAPGEYEIRTPLTEGRGVGLGLAYELT